MRKVIYFLVLSLLLGMFVVNSTANDYIEQSEKSLDQMLKERGARPVIENVQQTLLWENRNIQSTSAIVSVELRGLHPDSQLVHAADDFMVPAGTQWTIDSIYTEGFNSTGSVDPDSFGVIFYDNNAGVPGNVIYRENLVPGGTYPTNLEIALSSPLVLGTGTYWLSVVGIYDTGIDLTTRWNWYMDTVPVNTIAHLEDMTGIFGWLPWTPFNNLGLADPSNFYAMFGEDSVLSGIHDYAVNTIGTPGLMVAGNTYDIMVNVENVGTLDEIDVPVKLFEYSVEVGSQMVSLTAGQDSTLTFSYTPAKGGDFLLTAQSFLSLDTLNANDAASVNVSILPEGTQELFFDDFESGSGNFEITDLSGGGGLWELDSAQFYNMLPSPGYFVLTANSDAFGTGMASAATIDTMFDFSSSKTIYDVVLLDFDYDYQKFGADDDTGYVDVSIDGGTTWINLVKYDADTPFAHETLDVTGIVVGHDSVKFRFVYSTSFWDWWFTIDNVKVLAHQSPGTSNNLMLAFEDNSDISNWSHWDETNWYTTEAWDPTGGVGGSGALLLGDGGYDFLAKRPIVATPGTNFTISVDIKTSGWGDPTTYGLFLYVQGIAPLDSVQANSEGAFTTFKLQGTATNDSGYIRIYGSNTLGHNDVWVDNVVYYDDVGPLHMTIADARKDNDGDFVPDRLGEVVSVTGLITTPNFGSATDYIMQDATAGINLFTFGFENTEAVFDVGDEVMVTGEIAIYNGKTEIMPSVAEDVVVLSTGNAPPVPQLITIADIGEDYESELIRIDGVWLVDDSQWPSAGSNANVDITDGTDTLTMRIDKETDIDENAAPTGQFDLIGIGGQFDSGTPPDGGYQIQPRFYTDFILPDPSIIFADDFEAYTAGTALALQNSTDWTTWSNAPGGGEDPLVSNAYSYSGSKSVNVVTNNDLVKVHPDYTTGAYKMSFMLYVPTGSGAYFNTLQQWTPSPIWGMQVYFDANGQGNIDGDGANAAPFTYSYDTWMLCEVVVNLEHDWAEFYLDGVLIHGWQWSMGTFGTAGPVQLSANNFFGGGVTAPNYYFDDYVIREVSPAIFEDDFDSYTAGTQLVLQNSTDWATWSGGAGGTGEDPFVTDAYANSGSNSIVIVQNNDVVKLLGDNTSGSYKIAFEMYIPNGKAGYFNLLSDFTFGTGGYWAVDVFFDVGGGGRVLTSGTTNFTYLYDTWQLVEVFVDLDNDLAQFWLEGTLIHEWQWTAGSSGGTGPLSLEANDIWGATANDEMYVDDYVFDIADPITPVGIGDDQSSLPTTFDLSQNYPNPFNPTTTIKYQLPKKSDVKIVIFNLLGQKVRTIVDNSIEAGYHQVVWDGMNDYGNRVATGVYFYKMIAQDFVKSKKMILMK